LLELPLVRRPREVGQEVGIVEAVLPAEHLEHRVVDVVFVEQLRTQHLGIAAPDVARLARPGVDPHAGVPGSRVPLRHPWRAPPVALESLAHLRAQMLGEHRLGRLGVHVAIDERHRAAGGDGIGALHFHM